MEPDKGEAQPTLLPSAHIPEKEACLSTKGTDRPLFTVTVLSPGQLPVVTLKILDLETKITRHLRKLIPKKSSRRHVRWPLVMEQITAKVTGRHFQGQLQGDSGFHLIIVLLLSCRFVLATVMLWAATWRGPHRQELKEASANSWWETEASVQQLVRKWIQPTITWVSTFSTCRCDGRPGWHQDCCLASSGQRHAAKPYLDSQATDAAGDNKLFIVLSTGE